MKKRLKNFAFIDSQNLHLGIIGLNWRLDWKRFRIYLKEKHGVIRAYLFFGYIEKNKNLYDALEKAGYALIFKELLAAANEKKIKGNIDSELVLQAMIDYAHYDKALIISSDGDFSCLVKYLFINEKLQAVLSPHYKTCSILLRKAAQGRIFFLNNIIHLIGHKKRNRTA